MSTLALDGLAEMPSPCFLWVSADADRLTSLLEATAIAIVEGAAPEAFQGRRLIEVEAERLLAHLSDSDLPPVDQMEQFVRELEESRAALALSRAELLIDSDLAVDPLDAFCDAVVSGRIGCLVVMTDLDGLARLTRHRPRLLMLADVCDLDRGSVYVHRTITLTTAQTDELGWLAVVRCRLHAAAPALDQLESGESSPASGARLNDLGIDKCWVVRTDAGYPGLFISLQEDAADVNESEEAERIALSGARRLIERPLGRDEELEVTRMIHFSWRQ